MIQTDQGGTRFRALHGGAHPGNGGTEVFRFYSRVSAVTATTITLERNLPLQVDTRWTPQVRAARPTVREVEAGPGDALREQPDPAMKRRHRHELGASLARPTDLAGPRGEKGAGSGLDPNQENRGAKLTAPPPRPARKGLQSTFHSRRPPLLAPRPARSPIFSALPRPFPRTLQPLQAKRPTPPAMPFNQAQRSTSSREGAHPNRLCRPSAHPSPPCPGRAPGHHPSPARAPSITTCPSRARIHHHPHRPSARPSPLPAVCRGERSARLRAG